MPYKTVEDIAGVVFIAIGLFGYTNIADIILQLIQHRFEKEERGQEFVDFSNADTQSLHIVIRIKKMNRQAELYVELHN